MNISNAVTEAYSIYNRFHNNLNLTSKVAAAGILTLKRLVNVDNGDKIMGTLVDTVGLPWGTNKPFPNPTRIADKVYQNLAYNTFVQAFAGFEHYLTNLIADIAHFSERGRNEIFIHAHTDKKYNPNQPPEYSKCCLAYAEQFSKNNVLHARITELCDKLEVTRTEIDKLLPLFDYFRNIRNCIVHLNGTANKDLIESWEDSTFNESIRYWNSLSRKDAPELLEPTRGKMIVLNLTNSIMASALCFKIAQLINNDIVETIGRKGFIHMAAYFSLLVEIHEYRDERKSNTPEGSVSNYLSNRYYVNDYTVPEFVNELKSMKLWKHCRKRFEMIN